MNNVYSEFYNKTVNERKRFEQVVLPDTLPELLERAVSRHGSKLAINFFEDNESLTFSELGRRVNQIAHALSVVGVKPGTHVAVMLPNRIEFPLSWLAIASLGAVMVPVPTSHTGKEMAFLLADADVEYLIVDHSHVGVLDKLEGDNLVAQNIMVVGGQPSPGSDYRYFDALIEQCNPDYRPDHKASPDDLLNIQYTSGTTGLPKGVMQTQRYWVITGCRHALIWGGEMKSILSDHPFYYMDPQWMLAMGLYLGATVHFSRGMSVSRFMDWVHTYDVEFAYLPDPLLKRPPEERDAQTKVKVFLAYAFSREMIEQAENRYKGALVREGYGMTEIGGGLVVPPVVEDDAILGSCGIPNVFRQCRIVDGSGQDVPQGEIGELWVKGEGVSPGYYNRPDANEETFSDGWFRTGDLFRQDESGYYFIVGRIKDMVKRSGENISSLEVEMVLKDLPEVEEAGVIPVPDEYRDEEVKAYIKLADGYEESLSLPQSIIDRCAHSLAKFKLPRYIEFVNSFPLTPSDKIAKPQLITAKPDLRVGSYDAMKGNWISE